MNGQFISHYKILRKLGVGGMGEVYLAQDTKLDRQVALKLLPFAFAQEPERRQRFLTEAKAASALNHPNVCVIHEVGETDDRRPYLVMEHLEGQTLEARLRQGPVDLAEVVEIAQQVAEALEAAQAKGIVHRDIKPANIHLNERRRVKVLDFGLAKRLARKQPIDSDAQTQMQTSLGLVLGSPSYMSPEQALGREVDHRTDIFSFGVVLYELTTGRRPFVGVGLGEMIEKIAHAQPEPMARFSSQTTPELDRIVRKCLEKEPEQRYQSAQELSIDLHHLRREAQSGRARLGWGNREPVQAFARKHRSELATLVFTQLMSAAGLKHSLGDRGAAATIEKYRNQVREILAQGETGELIDTRDEICVLVFSKPSAGVQFALEWMSRQLGPVSDPGPVPRGRVGVHLGEVLVSAGATETSATELYGLQLDTCARVMELAEAGQILTTRAIFDSARQALKGEELKGLGELQWLNHGLYLLEGVEGSVEICEVGEIGRARLKPPEDAAKARRQVSPEAEAVLGWRPALEQKVPRTQWILEKKLGEGGFGEVWLGRHQVMKERRVFKFCFRVDQVRSLKREMTLFRVLKERIGDHPNIVRLLEVYFEEPPFYVVMDHVEGQDLKSWCEQLGGVEKVPRPALIEILAQIADALSAAHDAGVIHRDVKPANILVHRGSRGTEAPTCDEGGLSRRSEIPGVGGHEVKAKLTDFGIGQVVSEEALAGVTGAGFTQTIVVDSTSSQTGSQMYMAPELLAGKPASTRSDIYSLGVVLYQMLVGDLTRPLPTDWIKQITDPLLRDDLSRCFAGNPQERFEGAGQLAKNLRSLEARRAELERQRAEAVERERAAYRRGMIRAATLATTIVVAVTALAVFAFQQARRADRNAERVAATDRDLRRNLYVADMKLAHLALEQNNLGRAQTLLLKYLPTTSSAHSITPTANPPLPTPVEDLRGFEWRYLWKRSQGQETFSFRPYSNLVSCVAFSPDGKTFATGGYGQVVKVWSTSSQKLLASLAGFTNTIESPDVLENSLCFSPDGKLLASADKTSVVVWETANWQVKARLTTEERFTIAGHSVVFSPDGKTLATQSGRGVQFWETSSWGRRVALQFETRFGHMLSYSDDGRFLAIGGLPGMELWDGINLTKLDQLSGWPMSLKFSPGGSLLAMGDFEGMLIIWDAVTRREVTRWKAHHSGVRGLIFSPNGKILMTCGDDQVIHFWDLATQRRLSTLTGHQKRIWGMSLSPDGQTLASTSDDGTVKFWNLSPGVEGRELKQTLAPLWFSRDGRVVATVDTNLAVQFWEVPTRSQIRTVPPVVERKAFTIGRMAPDGKTAAIGRTNAAIELWNLDSRERIATLPNDEKRLMGDLIFSPDQHWLVSAHISPAAGQTYEGRLWNLATRQVQARFPMKVVGSMAFSPDSKILAMVETNRTVQLREVATGRELRTLKSESQFSLSTLYALAFSPDGKLLACGGNEFVTRVWEVASGKAMAVMSGHVGTILDVAFSPDGKTMATGSMDGTVKFWNTSTWQELMTLTDYGKKVNRLIFSPDGLTLAVGSALGDNEPGPVQLWRAPSLADIDVGAQR